MRTFVTHRQTHAGPAPDDTEKWRAGRNLSRGWNESVRTDEPRSVLRALGLVTLCDLQATGLAAEHARHDDDNRYVVYTTRAAKLPDNLSDDHFEIEGGDGGWMVYHPQKANNVYASYYNMNITRIRGTQRRDVSPHASNAEKESVWMVYITLDPNKPATVFTGSYRVWRSKDDATTWHPVSGSLDGSSISAIEVAPADSQRIYIGTENGGFFRSLDGGNTWSSNMAGPELPGVTITRLESSPTNADVLFATVANFGNSHVFRSDDAGAHWHDVDGGRLPDVPHHAVVVSPDDPNTVFAANDAGVYVSHDLGATWHNLKRNLPNTMFVDLVYHQGAGTLTTATYGRGIWRLKVRAS